MPFKLYPPGARGPCWYVRGTDSSGPYEASTGKEFERDAKRWVEEILLPARAGRRVPGTGEAVGFKTAAQHYKAAKPHLSKADIDLVDAVAEEIGEIDCRSVNNAALVAAANALKPACSDTTKNRKVIGPGAAVLHYAAEQKWCEYQRVRKFKAGHRSNRAPATKDTMAALMAHLEDPAEGMAPQWHGIDPNLPYKQLLLAMLYELGQRITDYLKIEWPNIDLTTGRVKLRIAKTDEWASLELSHVIVAMLANLPRTRTGRLFPWSTRRGVYAWLDRVRKRAGVHYTPHLSRHAMATELLELQIPDKKAAELGVWRDPRSLHRYQHVRPDAIPGRDAGFLVALGTRRGKKG